MEIEKPERTYNTTKVVSCIFCMAPSYQASSHFLISPQKIMTSIHRLDIPMIEEIAVLMFLADGIIIILAVSLVLGAERNAGNRKRAWDGGTLKYGRAMLLGYERVYKFTHVSIPR